MMVSPRCFLLEPTNFAVSTCEAFGELILLFDSQGSFWCIENFREHLLSRLKSLEYDPRTDFFLLTGRPTVLAIASAIIVQEYNGMKILVFSGSEKTYVAREI